MNPLDLSRPGELTQALAPELVLWVGAMLLMLWAAWRPESARHQRNVGIASMVVVLATMATVFVMASSGVTATNGVLAVDRFRWVCDIIFLGGTLLTLALAIDYNAREGLGAAESHVLLLFATSGMMLLASARDLIVLFLGVELMSIAVYVLAGLNRRSARSAEGALKYFLLGAFSTAFLLYGIALVYGASASTNIVTIGARVVQFGLMQTPLLLIGMAMLVVGFGFKVAAAPFHMWAPDVYEGAPTPITAYMAALVKAAAFAAFLRVWMEAFPVEAFAWHAPVWWLAAITMVAGNLIALAQRNIKRLLAYSSIAHAGYVLVAVVVGTPQGAYAFTFYLAAYTLATMGAFGVVIALGSEGERNLMVDDYSGLWHARPQLAVAMTVFMLALLGFPIFGGVGFLAKWYMLQAALQAPAPQTKLAVIIVLTSLVSAGYYLYVVMVMFMRPRRPDAPVVARAGLMTRVVIGLAAVLIIGLGLWPELAIRGSRYGAPQPQLIAPNALPPSALLPR